VPTSFGSLDHEVMLSTLGVSIRDGRFLRLVRRMLQAGYLEDWIYHATLSGSPQGGVASPILSNIYLDRLDAFVETVLIPEYSRGSRRTPAREYHRAYYAMRQAKDRGDGAEFRAQRKRLRTLPSSDPRDPGYRRLRYIRYADDVLFGLAGPKAEAEQIKARLTAFLRDDLKLELSADKTLITHARTGAARFLGYEITVQHSSSRITNRRRSVNGVIRLRVPTSVIEAKCSRYLTGVPQIVGDLE
jgi:Reverse transcriptase (RNA-dependent DNA polymerase)